MIFRMMVVVKAVTGIPKERGSSEYTDHCLLRDRLLCQRPRSPPLSTYSVPYVHNDDNAGHCHRQTILTSLDHLYLRLLHL
jgi:hypothetical protein